MDAALGGWAFFVMYCSHAILMQRNPLHTAVDVGILEIGCYTCQHIISACCHIRSSATYSWFPKIRWDRTVHTWTSSCECRPPARLHSSSVVLAHRMPSVHRVPGHRDNKDSLCTYVIISLFVSSRTIYLFWALKRCLASAVLQGN